MRTADLDILIVPASARLDPDHWQARWARNLKTARLMPPRDPGTADADGTRTALAAAVKGATRPVALIGHGDGVAAIVTAAPRLDAARIAGAFLAAPRSERAMRHDGAGSADLPRVPLPFASMLLASSTSPDCTMEEARELALAWGCRLSEAGDAGRIDAASGHGPWPDGLLRFGVFLKSLDG